MREQKKRLHGLDGLKGLALIAVILYHCCPQALPGGYLGVDVFFTVSGFLMAYGQLSRLESGRGFNLVNYYRGRIRRMYPALLMLVPTVV